MATTTQQKQQKQQLPLAEEAQAALKKLEATDPGLKQLLKKAYAYAVFPTVGKAGLVVGGSYGRGVVYERGKLVGYATIGQTTIGVQVGGITFTELLAFENKQAFDRFKQGGLKFAAGAAAVLVKAGAAGQADYEKGVIALAFSKGGMLLEAAIGGQKFTFKPKDGKQQKGGSDEDSGKSGKGGGSKASRHQDEDEDEGESDESSDEGDESESNGTTGLAGRAMSGVRGAASGVSDLVKRHPWASAAVGTTLVAGTIFAVRALRNAGGASGSGEEDESDESQDEDEGGEDQSEDEGDGSSDDDDEGAESSRDEEDDDSSDEDESGEQEEQSPRRGGRSRSRA